jgi:hypothetical protein
MVTSDGSVYEDEFVTHVNSPGYRSIGLEIKINYGTHRENVILKFNKKDAVAIMDAIRQINEIAWATGRPRDADQREQKPEWL